MLLTHNLLPCPETHTLPLTPHPSTHPHHCLTLTLHRYTPHFRPSTGPSHPWPPKLPLPPTGGVPTLTPVSRVLSSLLCRLHICGPTVLCIVPRPPPPPHHHQNLPPSPPELHPRVCVTSNQAWCLARHRHHAQSCSHSRRHTPRTHTSHLHADHMDQQAPSFY